MQPQSSPKSVKAFFQDVEKNFCNQEQVRLVKLFREFYREKSYSNIKPEKWDTDISYQGYTRQTLGANFASIVKLMKQFKQVQARKGQHYAFKIHISILNEIKELFELADETSQPWIFKPLRQIVFASKKIFLEAQKQYHQSGSSGVTVKKDDLIYCLQRFKGIRGQKQTKQEILPLVDNMQVSIMLKYHNYDQIRRIIEPKKAYGEHGPLFEDNYYFQRGKVALINQNMIEAEEYFEKIKIKTTGQKRLVLRYLIPCKIFLGKMFRRNPDLEDEYFPEYEPIISAIIRANFEEYNQAIQKYQKVWIKRGIYLLMDRLRKLVWRNLIKKVSEIIGNKINLSMIQKAVQLSGGFQKIDECICILSNLIYEGYIKGYIFQNQEARVLVLKKDGGFPKLAVIYT